MNPSDLPYKEEVAGSNPASATTKLLQKSGFVGEKRRPESVSWSFYCNPTGTGRYPGDKTGSEMIEDTRK
jgi:hypothetical protein